VSEMEFKLANGPWTTLFTGNFQGHDIEILSNPESMILVVIYEKEGDKIAGAVLELFKVFAATGEIEAFVETLPREVLGITKHDPKSTLKFFILGSTPNYVAFKEDAFLSEADKMLNFKSL